MNASLTSARPEPAKPAVLIVDDEPDLLELVSLTLSRMNLRTRTAGDVTTARKLLKNEAFDLCLTDMRLPDGDGLDLVAWIQENRSQRTCRRDHCPRQRRVRRPRIEARRLRFRFQAP